MNYEKLRFHVGVESTYPDRQTMGDDFGRILFNIPHYIYQRGGRVYTEESWKAAEKEPKLRQFLLTTSDYCRLYVTSLSYHKRRGTPDDGLFVPFTIGVVSRVPYLTFPKIFLSHMFHLLDGPSPWCMSSVVRKSLLQVIHAVPVPESHSSVVLWNLPSLGDSRNQTEIFLSDVGLEGNPDEECRPIPSSLNRSFLDVDLVALFDVLSLDVIISALNALLLEQKILLVSSKWSSSFISHLCEAFRLLMYPFDWHHVYIPLIPALEAGLTEEKQIPFWLGSARTSEHVHPLRFLDVPAPIFAGLRVSSNSPVQSTIRKLFPDVNVVDLDRDVFFPSLYSPCPIFPKKISTLVASRLDLIFSKLCIGGKPPVGDSEAQARLERYANWDRVIPRSIFEKGKRSQSIASLVGNEMNKSGGGDDSVSWFGAFSSFFRASPPSVSSRRTTTTTTESGNNFFELNAAEVIQAAFIEGFAKVFFSYKDFLTVLPPREAATESEEDGGHRRSVVFGSERSFETKPFLKSLGSSEATHVWAKHFVESTQAWDIFVRTTALYPICAVFDVSCLVFAVAVKWTVPHGSRALVPVPLPGTLAEEAEKILNGKKNLAKDHVFDLVLGLVRQARRDIRSLTVVTDIIVREEKDQDNPENAHPNLPELVQAWADLCPLPIPKVEYPKPVGNLGWELGLADAVSNVEARPAHVFGFVFSVWQGGGEVGPRLASERFRSVNSEKNYAGKVLGGIPSSALVVCQADRADSFLLRRWNAYTPRLVYRLTNIPWIDYSCGDCGITLGFEKVLAIGGFAGALISDAAVDEFVAFDCPGCGGRVIPRLADPEVKLLKLLRLVKILQENIRPFSKTVSINLRFLEGVQVEFSKDVLRGPAFVANLPNVVLDYGQAILEPVSEITPPTVSFLANDPVFLTPVINTVVPAGEQTTPMSPHSRAQWRIREYRKTLRKEKERKLKEDLERPSTSPVVPIIRIHVDDPPPPKPETGFNDSFRRKSSSGRMHSHEGMSISPGPSTDSPLPPVPPKERRPSDAAPRRLRQSNDRAGFHTPASQNDSGVDADSV